ncbi:MAG: MerR family transcriptional regulator [Cellulosilyticaceae bacterium]
MYRIGELSKLCKIPVKTLRYYDGEGILVPDKIDPYTGYRYYSAAQLMTCNRILALKELGFTLEEIKKQLYSEKRIDTLDLITIKERELRDIIVQTEQRLKKLSEIKRGITTGEEYLVDIINRKMNGFTVISLRKIFKTKREAIEQIEEMKKWLPANVIGKKSIIINYEIEYTSNYFDLEVCLEITGQIPTQGKYIQRCIETPFDVLTLACKQDELEQSYDLLTKEVEQTHAQVVGPFYEVYHEGNTVELSVPIWPLNAHSNIRHIDDIDIPFEEDQEVVGYWDVVDCVPTKTHFNPNKVKYSGEKVFKEFYFLPKGERYWCFSWTKGYLMYQSSEGTTCNRYEICKINDEIYMYLEMKGGEYIYQGGQPEYLILKQINNKEYKVSELAVKDEIDYKFIVDEEILGKWVSVDFLENKTEFVPNQKKFLGVLWCEWLLFEVDGTFRGKYNGREIYFPERFVWTKGCKIDLKESIAEDYHIERLNNQDYLFVMCKNGDYIYGGRQPWYWVFTRELTS